MTTDFSDYIEAARKAIIGDNFNQVTIFAIAEYLDLVAAREIKPNAEMKRECTKAVADFVLKHLENPAYVPFWERADCLFKAYKRALRSKEPVAASYKCAISY